MKPNEFTDNKNGGLQNGCNPLFTLIATCHFGLEAVLKREIYDLGYDIAEVTDGRVSFLGDAEAIVRANICLRTAERVLLLVGQFRATTFTELFDETKTLPWKNYLPADAKFWVTKASTVKSELHSAPDIQSIVKKAMVERLKLCYDKEWFPEDGAAYPARVFLLKDEATIALDTSGTPLHKRGYRTETSDAPLSETMAAALISLTPWRAGRILIDPFCGSGTFPIEAAMMARHIAPGVSRKFTAEQWTNLIPAELWADVRDEVREEADAVAGSDLSDGKTDANAGKGTKHGITIQGFDKDPAMIRIARENAARAGVLEDIHFQVRDVKDTAHPKPYGFLITNPPYGERLMKEEREALFQLYRTLGNVYQNLDKWSMYVITAFEDAERAIGKKADKNRKLYNGMMKTYFYSYLGEKPPRGRK